MFQSFAFLFGGPAAPIETVAPSRENERALPRLGIALGGGAARGWSHIGVLKRFAAHGLVPDVVVGTSIGAVAGACHVAGKLAELETFARSLNKRKVLGLLDISLGGGGLIGGRRLEEMMERHLADLHIETLSRPFVAVATEFGTGHEIWLKHGPLIEAVRASYALPGIFEPVRIGNRWLFDGALVNPIPVSVCRAFGARVVVAVNLHGETFGRGITVTGQEPEHHLLPAAPELRSSALRERTGDRAVRRSIVGPVDGAPSLSAVMVEAFNITQDRIARSRLAGDPPDVMIAPRLSRVGLFDFHRAEESIAAGEEAAERAIGDVFAAVAALA
jgi:NTE family protein